MDQAPDRMNAERRVVRDRRGSPSVPVAPAPSVPAAPAPSACPETAPPASQHLTGCWQAPDDDEPLGGDPPCWAHLFGEDEPSAQ